MNKNKEMCLVFLMCLTSFPPLVITSINPIGVFLNVLQVLFFVYLLFQIITVKKKPVMVCFAILFSFIVIISTLIDGRETHQAYIFLLNNVGAVLMVEYYLIAKPRYIIEGMYYYFTVLAIVSYVYFVFMHYGKGVVPDKSLFITVSNSVSPTLIFIILLMCMYHYISNTKITVIDKCIVLSLVHTEILVWSGTGMTGFFMFLLFIVLIYGKQIQKRLNIYVLTSIAIVVFIAVTIFRVQDIFSYFIEDVLKKDLTFTGRTVIWDYYIKQIKNSIWLGYGEGYRPYGNGLFAHSGYLELMIKGGFVGTAIFVVQLLVASIKLQHSKCDISYAIVFMLFCFFIMMLTEMPSITIMTVLFVFGYYIDKIEYLRLEVLKNEENI